MQVDPRKTTGLIVPEPRFPRLRLREEERTRVLKKLRESLQDGSFEKAMGMLPDESNEGEEEEDDDDDTGMKEKMRMLWMTRYCTSFSSLLKIKSN